MHIIQVGFLQKVGEFERDRSSSDYQFHYVCGGRGSLEWDHGNTVVKSGSFFHVLPGERYRFITDRKSGFASQYIMNVVFPPGFDKHVTEFIKPYMNSHRLLDIGGNSRNFFEQLRTRIHFGDGSLEQAAKHQFLAFLFELCSGRPGYVNNYGDDRIEDALKYMQDQVRQKLILEDVAGRVSLNESYFIRLFKRHIGIAPMKYFMELKFRAAAGLLEDTTMSVSETAEYLGITDEFYFSRSFKKFTGLSPKHYREKHCQR